ncbi:MAG: DUF885 domain-containing protein [Myxococcota bacterium]
MPFPLRVALVLLTACATTPAAPPPAPHDAPAPSPWTDDVVAGIDDPALAALLTGHWEDAMRRAPEWATQLGDHRYDDRLGDVSEAGLVAARATRDRFLARAEALPAAGLSPSDRVTRDLFVQRLQAERATDVCAFETWSLSARSNLVTAFNHVPQVQPLGTPAEGAAYLARLEAMPAVADATVANLRRGLEAGLVANAETARRVVAMLEAQVAKPLAEWPLQAAVAELEWDAERTFASAVRTLLETELRPALARAHTFLRDAVLPVARPEERTGVGALPNGAACYRAQIRNHTGTDLTPDALHAIGREEMARIDAETAALGARALGTDSLEATLARLRDDPALRFDSREGILASANAAVDAARDALPRAFGRLPRAPVEVVPIPDYEAPFTTIAYYRPPAPDGSRPGEYFINLHAPETRPRYTAQVLAFHEAIPGHHLQIALATEQGALPLFRRHFRDNAYVEGWALYTERLADELGLYGSDLDRLGMLAFDAWRAGRLVVDTGLHHLGWSRNEAIAYLRAHAPLSATNIENEVDRYISWPGQALGYKVGQRAILALREEARAALGDQFSLADFHDVVLGSGPVTLAVLRDQVEAWIARTGG